MRKIPRPLAMGPILAFKYAISHKVRKGRRFKAYFRYLRAYCKTWATVKKMQRRGFV